MAREVARKVILVVVGLLFVAGAYPIGMYLWHPGNQAPGDSMMMSLYVALGVFLLIAAGNPSAHRSLIAFGAWGNFAHCGVMLLMAVRIPSDRKDFLVASAMVGFIGLLLLAATPAKAPQTSAAGAS